jgi:hypothetical protein
MFRRVIPLLILLPASGLAAEPAPKSPEQRALAFLAREVPRWSRRNHCFSCHNNGDAARALYAGRQAGYRIEASSLAETTAWLAQPASWDHNGGDGPFSDKRLARVQFTTTLIAARQAGELRDQGVVFEAGARLARDQAPDGSWPLEGENEPGSPATYGRFLATHLARESLRAADSDRYRRPIARAGEWLVGHRIESVMDASVMLMVCSTTSSARASTAVARSLEILREGQSEQGGWGPFHKSAPEVFDTSLALLALSASEDSAPTRGMVARGRAFLLAQQQADGSWVETTRPSGAESYAQRVSTSAWATMALIRTR